MNPKKVVFYSCVVLILILLLLNIRLITLGNKFDTYCTTKYNITDVCPCLSKKFDSRAGFMPNLTIQEPLYTKSQHPYKHNNG